MNERIFVRLPGLDGTEAWVDYAAVLSVVELNEAHGDAPGTLVYVAGQDMPVHTTATGTEVVEIIRDTVRKVMEFSRDPR